METASLPPRQVRTSVLLEPQSCMGKGEPAAPAPPARAGTLWSPGRALPQPRGHVANECSAWRPAWQEVAPAVALFRSAPLSVHEGECQLVPRHRPGRGPPRGE